MDCIRCQEYIPPNDCFCDICETVGCGCQFQPPNEVYLEDPDNEDERIGPFCSSCVSQVERSGTVRTYRIVKSKEKVTITKAQRHVVEYLQARTYDLKETSEGYFVTHSIAGYTFKVRSITVAKLIELGILEYRSPDDETDPYLQLTSLGWALPLS